VLAVNLFLMSVLKSDILYVTLKINYFLCGRLSTDTKKNDSLWCQFFKWTVTKKSNFKNKKSGAAAIAVGAVVAGAVVEEPMPLDETSKGRGTDLSPSSSGYAAAPLPCPGRALAMGRSLTKSLEAEAACARLSSGHAAASVEVAAAKGGVNSGESALVKEEDKKIIPDLMGAGLSGSVGTNDGFGLDSHGAPGARSHHDGVFKKRG
jgi:hypothetical protein